MFKDVELIQLIREYESDTFSAEGFELTDDEAVKLAQKCVDLAVIEFIDNRLDGVNLDRWLAEIRGIE